MKIPTDGPERANRRSPSAASAPSSPADSRRIATTTVNRGHDPDPACRPRASGSGTQNSHPPAHPRANVLGRAPMHENPANPSARAPAIDLIENRGFADYALLDSAGAESSNASDRLSLTVPNRRHSGPRGSPKQSGRRPTPSSPHPPRTRRKAAGASTNPSPKAGRETEACRASRDPPPQDAGPLALGPFPRAGAALAVDARPFRRGEGRPPARPESVRLHRRRISPCRRSRRGSHALGCL